VEQTIRESGVMCACLIAGRGGPATRAIPDSPAVRGANKERAALPVTSDEKGALPIARRRKW
jgi:hypothetical protein